MLRQRDLTDGAPVAVLRAMLDAGTPEYDVMDDSPDTDIGVIQHYQATGRLAVWSGASEGTVYGPREANWMYRAWHDWCHISSGVCNRMHGPLGCFEPSAEADVTSYQIRNLGTRFAELVKADTAGQTAYYGLHGGYVDHQGEFVLDLLNRTGHHDVLSIIDNLGRFK